MRAEVLVSSDKGKMLKDFESELLEYLKLKGSEDLSINVIVEDESSLYYIQTLLEYILNKLSKISMSGLCTILIPSLEQINIDRLRVNDIPGVVHLDFIDIDKISINDMYISNATLSVSCSPYSKFIVNNKLSVINGCYKFNGSVIEKNNYIQMAEIQSSKDNYIPYITIPNLKLISSDIVVGKKSGNIESDKDSIIYTFERMENKTESRNGEVNEVIENITDKIVCFFGIPFQSSDKDISFFNSTTSTVGISNYVVKTEILNNTDKIQELHDVNSGRIFYRYYIRGVNFEWFTK